MRRPHTASGIPLLVVDLLKLAVWELEQGDLKEALETLRWSNNGPWMTRSVLFAD